MLKIHKNYSLKNNTTFGVDIVSSWFTEPETVEELEYGIRHAQERALEYLIIGEGSNLLFTGPYEGMIIHPLLSGIDLLDESETELMVKVGAGVNWDAFVEHCVRHNWYGTENLSLIPGSVGATPVQNIGAYGVEAKDLIEYVEVFNTQKLNVEILSNTACKFAYRDSIFKHIYGEHYIVINVVFNLKKKKNFVLDYGNVKEEFMKFTEQNLANLRQTIISIRENKLPDPEETGNAGSFFKNPVVP
ncbi:MAG: UDP-N-acetylmuramate dehydrogenase, partial [Bacteroidales bacterium]